MKRLLKYMFVVACSVLLFACKSANASGKVVYCSSIAFSDALRTSGIVLYVDDNYTFGTHDVIVNPVNSTVGYYFESANTTVVEVNGNTINAKATGTTTLKVKAMQSSAPTYVFDELTVQVKPNPMYVISCVPMYSIVHLQLGDTATNQLMVNDGINVDNAFEVVIDDADVASYDYQTGVVSALGVGQTTVHITYRTGANTYGQCSFDVDVYVPATSVSLANSGNMQLYVGDTGQFGGNDLAELIVVPQNYSMGVTFSCNNTCLSVDSSGHYTANSAGNATISITYYTAYGITAHVDYNVVVVAKPTQLSIAIANPGTNPLNYYYVYDENKDNTYIATVSSNVAFVLADIDKITLVQNDNIQCVSKSLVGSDIVVTFKCVLAGSTSMQMQYALHSYAGDSTIDDAVELNVYNYITQPLNISLTPVSAVNGVLTLNMCDAGEHVNTTILTVTSAQTQHTAGYHIDIADSTIIEYNTTTGVITSSGAGQTTITIATYDGYLDNVVITVNVLQCVAESINVPESINLFVGGDVGAYSNSANYVYTLLPECATDTPAIETSSEYLVYNNGIITASHSGEYTVTVSTANCNVTTYVHVYDLPDSLEVKLNSTDVANQTVRDLINTTLEFDYLLKVDGNAVSYNYPIEVTSSNDSVLIDATKVNKFGLSSTVECSSVITVSFGSIVVQFTVEFFEFVDIPTTSIEASDVEVNYKESHTAQLNYTVLPANTTDELVFDYDNTYFEIVNDVIELKSTCSTITFPVDVQVTITSGAIDKIINVRLYNYTTISTLNELRALDSTILASYALASDINISELATIDTMNFVLLGNGHKLTHLSRLFALNMTQYGGMVDVIFDDVQFEDTTPIGDGEILEGEGSAMIVGRVDGVLDGVQVNGYASTNQNAFLSVFGTLKDVARNITVNLQVDGYKMRGVFNRILYTANVTNLTIDLTVDIASVSYICALNLDGHVNGLDVTLNITFENDANVYVLANNYDEDAQVQNYSFDVTINDLSYENYVKVRKTGNTSIANSEMNVHTQE